MTVYAQKNVTVVGLARSGIAAARLLKNLGATVRLTEANDSPGLRDSAGQLEKEGIAVELGGHGKAFVGGAELLVLSPGVRLDALPVVWARESGIGVIGEIELAASVCPAPIIAITGTNGKTTTTTLIGEVLKAAGRNAHVLGNIGRPFSQNVLSVQPQDFVVLEVSSFQLETIKNFHPRVALILNLTPDHMDRYVDIAAYLQAKKRIFANQGSEDWLVLNYGDEFLRPLADQAKARVLFFNNNEESEDFNQNQMAVLAVTRVLGVDRQVCVDVFKGFKGVEHRLEFVRELGGVEFINDSKATNIDSTIWALKNTRRPAVLIAGGRDKGSDFSSINALVREKVKYAVLVGEASKRIAGAWEGVLPYSAVATYAEAVCLAQQKAQAGDCVLLSPMCKSFDMFTDYEHRGRVFKELVHQLK
ncbi:MAG: Mur ligase family protein [Candidatus Omnitrophota bacterium]